MRDAYGHGVDEPGTRPAETSAYVVGDVHGHRGELVAALRAAGLVGDDERWSGGATPLWFLGDFFDRGPDGVGVVDLVMSLSEQAEADGGSVRALLGNHEILTLGMHRFGGAEVPSEFGPRSFERSWRLNGGQADDQLNLSDRHLTWLSGLPVMAHADDDHLLMHSDTVEYFGWGETIDEINARVHEVLAGDDIDQWWECWRRMTTRYAFRGPGGADVAAQVLAAFGGSRIVHGHSVIADQLGIAPSEVDGPCLYADGRVLGVDGGVFVGGPCLVVRLPLEEPSRNGSEPADVPGTGPSDSDVVSDGEPASEPETPDAPDAKSDEADEPDDEPAEDGAEPKAG